MPTQQNPAVDVSVSELVQLHRQAARICLQSQRIKARQSGEYRSGFKGRGMEFDESRPYQPGDDIRNIDWRVTARTGRPHTKLFREERERPVFIWLDLRQTMFFATRGRFKSVLAAQLAGMLAWSALQHGDRIGGLIFADAEHHEVKPGRGKAAVLRLLNQIARQHQQHNATRKTNTPDSLAHALRRLRRVARPGSLLFLLSDFRGLTKAAELQLNRLGKHNEVTLLFIHDQLEVALPPAGLYKVTNGREDCLLDTHDRALVDAYQHHCQQRLEQLQSLAKHNRMRLLSCQTSAAPLTLLATGLGQAMS